MTNTDTMLDIAARAVDGGDSTNVAKASKMRLKASSEAPKKQETTSVPAATSKKTAKSIPAGVSIGGAARAVATEQSRPTKASAVEALLSRKGGASLEAMCDATGWQAHTCRAFLTGLRKKGKEVIRASDKEGKSIYLIAAERPNESSPAAKQAEERGS
ncbi:DUF3489 domain-containing protein [Erythrobacter sp.]|uniref:DUF3489 domain-containing protein n=1 Tax=Erythrobacter sp. TaxID=1042 RepID=UPI0025F1E945|nr:DUF3489 domain-containing protein [Erythrobacter sp.]